MDFSIASLVASSVMLAPEPPAGLQFFADDSDSAENKCPKLAPLFYQITNWRNSFVNPYKVHGVAEKSPEQILMEKMVEFTKKLHRGRIAIELAIERGFNIHGAREIVGELVSAGREYDRALHSYPMNTLLNQACVNADLRRIFGGCYLTQEAVTFFDYPDSGLGTGVHNSNLSGYSKVVAGHRIEWLWKNDVKGRKKLVNTSLELYSRIQ